MVDMNTLLAEMRSGRNAEDITKEFVEAMNKATKQHEAEVAAEAARKAQAEAAKAKEQAAAEERRKDIKEAVAGFVKYINKWYPNLKFIDAPLENEGLDYYIKELDKTINSMSILGDLFTKNLDNASSIRSLFPSRNKTASFTATVKNTDPIQRFLKENGLL